MHHNSLTMSVCKKCYQKFYIDGDMLATSLSYASRETSIVPKKIENITTYRDWLIFAMEYCDDCRPKMPEKVQKDIEKENIRKQKDKEEAQKIKMEGYDLIKKR